MLVNELRHDFLINKKLGEEIELSSLVTYNKKYSYFWNIPYYYDFFRPAAKKFRKKIFKK